MTYTEIDLRDSRYSRQILFLLDGTSKQSAKVFFPQKFATMRYQALLKLTLFARGRSGLETTTFSTEFLPWSESA